MDESEKPLYAKEFPLGYMNHDQMLELWERLAGQTITAAKLNTRDGGMSLLFDSGRTLHIVVKGEYDELAVFAVVDDNPHWDFTI